MLSPCFTDVSATRARGGLSTDESTGAATVAQIEAAIMIAQRELKRAVGSDLYSVVVAFTDATFTDPDTGRELQDEYDAFDNAESYFALAALPEILGNQQLAAIGYLKLTQIDAKTVQTFATTDDVLKTSARWKSRAIAEIAPYVTTTQTQTDDNGDSEDIGIGSEDGSFYFTAI